MRKSVVVAVVCFLLLAVVSACSRNAPPKSQFDASRDHKKVVASTTLGPVAGMAVDEQMSAFLGIPYAKPPKGQLRFEPPEEPLPWSNELPAISFGPTCPQREIKFDPASFYYKDEDCLTLNVWTPGVDGKRRPVVVFIHGGGFIMGGSANPLYDGTNMARRGDIVVVSMNYRLGALGFSYLAENGGNPASGNLGLLDQIAAIKWVKNNIASFGGDPDTVTIMGESAGSMSVTTLMAVPIAKGLFIRAIAESGSPNLSRSRDRAKEVTAKLFNAAGVTDAAGLKALPLDRIVDAQNKLFSENKIGAERMFTPVIDGTVLPLDPFKAIEQGSAKGISLLEGSNKDEFRMWLFVSPLLTYVPPSWMLKMAPDIEAKLGKKKDEIIDLYKRTYPSMTRGQVGMELAGDIIFWIPSVALAEAQLPHGKVWMYEFAWQNPKDGGRYGAHHGLELAFVMDNYNETSSMFLDAPPPQRLVDEMNAAWTAFIRTGDPQIPELPGWPVYDRKTRSTMIFDLKCQVQDDMKRDERLIFKGLLY